MLLLDQNLSDKIVDSLQSDYPGTRHVKHVGLNREADEKIWDYARRQGLTIVTNDDDFANLSEYHGFPPKVIHLVAGNLSRKQMLNILVTNSVQLHQFITSKTEGYLALS
ncbi:MAG: DUF5615 family PIN-like protein [Spirochaetes bacterium]|nr:DUF5615 family PIN-like protein [Spirochaetota bacterium]